MVAQGFSPGEETYKYGNPDERRGGILSRRSTKCEDGNAQASICSIALCHPAIRWGSVCFCAIPTGFVRVAHSTPWLLYAASPCGEAPEFGLPCRSAGSPKTEAPVRGRKNSGRWWSER